MAMFNVTVANVITITSLPLHHNHYQHHLHQHPPPPPPPTPPPPPHHHHPTQLLQYQYYRYHHHYLTYDLYVHLISPTTMILKIINILYNI